MPLVKFNPYRGFEGVSRRMNKFFNEFEKGFTLETGSVNPRVDISENQNNLIVNMEIAGLNKEDISIEINADKVLTIKGEKKREVNRENKTFIRSERSYGKFSRSFVLPETIEGENIDAKFNKGVLEITMQKTAPVKPKEIEVEIS